MVGESIIRVGVGNLEPGLLELKSIPHAWVFLVALRGTLPYLRMVKLQAESDSSGHWISASIQS